MGVAHWRIPVLVLLLAPGAAAQVTDHLSCYRVKDPLALRGIVDIDAPGIGLSPGCKISRPTRLCVPATKTVQEAVDGSTRPPTPITPGPVAGPSVVGRYVCYKVRCPKDQPPAGDQTITDQFGARTLDGGRAVELCTPAGLFVGGAWLLTGTDGPEVCPAPPFPNSMSIVQNGTALTASGPLLPTLTGSTSATGFELRQSAQPFHALCPAGGFYDAFLSLTGTVEADGTIRVTQRWILFPPVSSPGCPPCSKTWDGVMTPLS